MLRRSAGSMALCVALLLAGTSACSDDGDGPDRMSGASPDIAPQPGQAAPGAANFAFETFDGEAISLAAYAGKPLVVNFFSSWCTPCITEMPDFEAIHQELGDRVTFVGINYGLGGETLAAARDIVERTGVTYDVVRDPEGDGLAALGGVTMPTTVLLDGEGMVVEVRSGAISKSALRSLIGQKLGVT